MKKLNLFIILLFCSTFANATIRNVPSVYSNIQSAINASINGDTVLVEPGTYYENINFRGKKIIVTSRFFYSNDLSYLRNTIINGSSPSSLDSASCVRFHNSEDSTTVLQGFTITGGTGTRWTDEHAAGIYREGGGILIALCSPIIKNNIIINNEAINTTGVSGAGGGGIRIGDGNPKILNNIIMNNKGLYGAGIVLNYTGVLIKNNIICYNSQSSTFSAGSAIWADNLIAGKPRIIENNTIVHNSAINGTAGVLSNYSSNLILRNNIIWGNTSPGGTQVLATGGGLVMVSYSDIQGGYTGTGNISTYPLFADTNYILANGSPCVDAGDTSIVYYDPADSSIPNNAKFPSKGGRINDMGAYGGQGSMLLSGISVVVVQSNNTNVPGGFILSQNYPNPFNPTTNIRYQIPKSSFVNLTVYDVLGKEVEILINSYLKSGRYEVTFSGKSLSSGIYYYRLTADGFREERKMIYIK